jgi:transcriptional regulator with XRE-family HTH domain
MKTFSTRTIQEPILLGHQLRAARDHAGWTLKELAVALRIEAKHLEHIESSDFEALPFARIYIKGMIRTYCQELGICPHTHLALFDEQYPQQPQKHAHHAGATRLPIHQLGGYIPQIAKYGGAGLVLVGLIGYLGMQVRHIIEPPTLQVATPQNGIVVTSRTLLVEGSTEAGVDIYLNGTPIGKDESGRFTEEIQLSEGINPITLMAKKKHGKQAEETRFVIFKEVNSDISYNQ